MVFPKERKVNENIKINFTKKDAKKLWSRLFGEEDQAKLRDLTDTQFDRLVNNLENMDAKIEWEANKAGKTILLWKPKENDPFWKDYAYFLLLLSFLNNRKSAERWLGK